jgi:thiosulfate dehydrogenase
VAGKDTYLAACAWCHGAATTGQGRLNKSTPRLPQDTFADHKGYTEAEVWAVFVEKVRHGPFWGYGGAMPPFGLEALSDAELGDVLSYLWTLR